MYCSHCLAISWSLIPCDYCYSMFCSEGCKREALEKYHDIECLVDFYKILACIGDGLDYQFIVTRALIMGIREAGGIDGLRERLQIIDECNMVNSVW